MDFWFGYLYVFFLPAFAFFLANIVGVVVTFRFPLKSKVYCIGNDDIIYLCEVFGCGYHEGDDEDNEFYYHFVCCTNSEIGWAYTEDEVSKNVFYTYAKAERALKKRSKSDD